MVMPFSGCDFSRYDSFTGWKLDYEFARTGITPLVHTAYPVAAYAVYPRPIIAAGISNCSEPGRLGAGYVAECSPDHYLCHGHAAVSPVESRRMVTVHSAVARNRRAVDGSGVDDGIHEEPYG